MRQVITAQDVPPGGELRVVRGAIVTPSARELMAARGVRLLEVSQEEMPAPPPERVVAQLIALFGEVEEYWKSGTIGPHIRLLPVPRPRPGA